MKKRFVLFVAVMVCAFVGGLGVMLLWGNTNGTLDSAAVNDVAMTYYETADSSRAFDAAKKYGFSVTILDDEENLVSKTGTAAENLSEAISQRQTVVTLKNDKGYVIVSDDFAKVMQDYRNSMLLAFSVCAGIILLAALIYALYILNRVIKPFEKLRGFASRVAQGNLDTPLEMDRANIFGAFTESFDIMREELSEAKERERAANQSKKELVASLSHDIKTPVASIRATAELLDVMTTDNRIKGKLEGIQQKTDQIELLINNLFNATLEELQELDVKNAEESSDIVRELLTLADYSGAVKPFDVPQCLLFCDKLRLGQVFDNIISNSYKYADTEIEVKSFIDKDFLITEISDKGNGVNEEETGRCCDKFFRGENSNGKNGSGLGLYISHYFCEKMGGTLEIKSENGFTVRVIIPLVK